MVGWIGKDELASHQIALNIASITYLVCLGLSTAGTIRVGNAVGSKKKEEVKIAGTVALSLGISFMIFAGCLLILFKDIIPFLYTSDAEVVVIAPKLLLIAAFFQIFDGAQAIALGNLRGITDVRVPMVITFVAYWLIGLPSAYILGFPVGLGTEGVWYGLSISLIASSVMLNTRFFLKIRNPAFLKV
jgi:MATE family multidrug resistance protein